MEVFSPLVGVTFRGAEVKEIVKNLTADDGERLTLEREPTNPYDVNAVKVLCDGTHVGYIAKENNIAVAMALDEGAEVSVKIIGFENTIKPTLLLEW